MYRIQRYIFGALFLLWFGMVFGLIALAAMINSLSFLPKIINEGMPIGVFLKFVAFGIPTALWLILPITLYLATIIVYSRLKSESELTVMQGTGLSNSIIGAPALVAAVIAVVLCGIISYFYVPLSNQGFRLAKHENLLQLAPSMIQEGTFIKPLATNVVIYAREKLGPNDMRGVTIYDGRDIENPSIVSADAAKLVEDDGAYLLILERATQTGKAVGDQQPPLLYFDRYAYRHQFEDSAEDYEFVKPRELYWDQLYTSIVTRASPKRRNAYVAELIDRVLSLILPIGYVALALNLVVLGQTNRKTQGHQTLIALCALGGIELARFSTKNIVGETLGAAPIFICAFLAPLIISVIIYANYKLRMRAKDRNLGLA